MAFPTHFIIFIVLSALLMNACQSAPKRREPMKASSSLEQEFKQGRQAMESGDSKKALARFKKIAATSPDSELADDANMLSAQIYERQQLWKDALQVYLSVAHGDTKTPLETDALLRAARIYVRFNQLKEALDLVGSIANSSIANQAQKYEASELKGEIFLTENRFLEALELYVELYSEATDNIRKEKYRLAAQDLLDTKLNEEQLSEVADRKAFGFLRPIAKYRIALSYAEQKQLSRARSAFQDVVSLASGTELAERAAVFVTQIDARSRVSANTIGAILPLSGRQQAIGYRALRGLQLGLGIYGLGNKNSGFRLAVIDSEGNPDIARRAVERLVVEDNTIALVGGLLSRTAGPEVSKAQEFGVPTIVLGQKAGLTESRDFIFRNALTSQMQADHLAQIAIERLGIKRFAIMFPNDAYGTEFANFFWDAVKVRGGSINAAQPYDPKETDFRGPVQRMVGNFYLEDRADEYRLRYRQYLEKNPRRSTRQGDLSPEEILPPVVDFDALFIPDSARAAGQIAPMLAYNDIGNVRLLGTNLWNNSTFVSRGQKFVEGAIVVDGLYSGDHSFSASEFVKSYKDVFGEEPGMIEAQAYDTGLLIKELIAGGASTRIDLQAKLTTVKGFPGAFGPLDMNAARELQRPISVMTVKDGALIPLDTVLK